jgi:hypothetical protein
MTMFAIYNHGNDRKGKFKRITRSEKFVKLINYFTEKKIGRRGSDLLNPVFGSARI